MAISTFPNIVTRRNRPAKVFVSSGDFNGKKSWIDVSDIVGQTDFPWEIFERVYTMLSDPTYENVKTAKIETDKFNVIIDRKSDGQESFSTGNNK